jgi:hypothetical protein
MVATQSSGIQQSGTGCIAAIGIATSGIRLRVGEVTTTLTTWLLGCLLEWNKSDE